MLTLVINYKKEECVCLLIMFTLLLFQYLNEKLRKDTTSYLGSILCLGNNFRILQSRRFVRKKYKINKINFYKNGVDF